MPSLSVPGHAFVTSRSRPSRASVGWMGIWAFPALRYPARRVVRHRSQLRVPTNSHITQTPPTSFTLTLTLLFHQRPRLLAGTHTHLHNTPTQDTGSSPHPPLPGEVIRQSLPLFFHASPPTPPVSSPSESGTFSNGALHARVLGEGREVR